MSVDVPRPASDLTPRQLEVLKLICDGHSTKQIAAALAIRFKTAACHRARLMEKAEVHDSISLFRWAVNSGYITVGFRPQEAVSRPAVRNDASPSAGLLERYRDETEELARRSRELARPAPDKGLLAYCWGRCEEARLRCEVVRRQLLHYDLGQVGG